MGVFVLCVSKFSGDLDSDPQDFVCLLLYTHPSPRLFSVVLPAVRCI